ncbi:MAG: AAA family ATPase [Nitrospira sp.]|nr:AAA family ATPase [Nitrospira sp.]
MKISKIALVGFRGATVPVELSFHPSKPVALIFGENGTGKSTIADAFDFLCNRSYGSLANYSLGQSAKKYIASLGTSSSALTVTITAETTSWTATLGSDGPIVSPSSGYPDAQILRRKTILKLIEAVPKDRFEELRAFIAVPNVEKAESSLRDAVRLTKDEFNQCSAAFSQAKDSLEELWKAEGNPGTDPFSWAASEVKKDISQLKTNMQEIENLEASFLTSASALTSLDEAIATETKARTALTAAKEKLQAAEADQKKQTSELVKLLQEAKAYIEERPELNECPVCENSINPTELVHSLTVRITEMEELKTLGEAVANAKKHADSKFSLVSGMRKELCKGIRLLGNLLRSSNLSEVTNIKIPWDNFVQLMSGEDPSPEIEGEARNFWKQAASSRSPLKTKKESAQKTVSHYNAVKGYVETYRTKQFRAQALEALLKKLQELYEVASRERKAYVEEILTKISEEVEKLYAQLHPDEGIGKIRFFLKPNTIGSLEFDGHFQSASAIPPQAYYSESHLDTLGICVFLALAKHYKTDKTVVVLDDVLTSIDSPHLDRFMKLLHKEARTFKQMIVTTHYRPWRDRYRWAKGSLANTQMIELGPWTLEKGLHIGEFLTAVEELRNSLSVGAFDRQAIASKAGIILESLLDFLTLKYRCAVPRNATGEHTLGELAQGIDSKLAKEMRSRKAVTKGAVKADTMLKPLIEKATGRGWVRNTVGCHFTSLGSEISDGEVKSFGNEVLDLSDALICSFCHRLPTRRPSGSFWQCECGELELYPLVYPGAHPGTADDEA